MHFYLQKLPLMANIIDKFIPSNIWVQKKLKNNEKNTKFIYVTFTSNTFYICDIHFKYFSCKISSCLQFILYINFFLYVHTIFFFFKLSNKLPKLFLFDWIFSLLLCHIMERQQIFQIMIIVFQPKNKHIYTYIYIYVWSFHLATYTIL